MEGGVSVGLRELGGLLGPGGVPFHLPGPV